MRSREPYRVRVTPFARQQLAAEMAYSRRRWGRAHPEAFRRSLLQRLERIAAAPHAVAERPELGEGVRVARQGGLLIVFLVNETAGQVEIVAFPNIHRELGRSVAASLEARLGEDDREKLTTGSPPGGLPMSRATAQSCRQPRIAALVDQEPHASASRTASSATMSAAKD